MEPDNMLYREVILHWIEETEDMEDSVAILGHSNVEIIQEGGKKAIKALLDLIEDGEANEFFSPLLENLAGCKPYKTKPAEEGEDMEEVKLHDWIEWGVEEGFLPEPSPDDQGGFEVALGLVPPGHVTLNFTRPVDWIGLDADSAEDMGRNLITLAEEARDIEKEFPNG